MSVSNSLNSIGRPMMPPLALTSSMANFMGWSPFGLALAPEKIPITAIFRAGPVGVADDPELALEAVVAEPPADVELSSSSPQAAATSASARAAPTIMLFFTRVSPFVLMDPSCVRVHVSIVDAIAQVRVEQRLAVAELGGGSGKDQSSGHEDVSAVAQL